MKYDEFFKIEMGKAAPRRRPKDEEHQLQVACVRWFVTKWPKLRLLLFAVPNGGRRDEATGARLKEEGVVAGVADLLLLVPRGELHGLCIEMKTEKGRQSGRQKQWAEAVEGQGYRYAVCRSLDDFIDTIVKYMKE